MRSRALWLLAGAWAPGLLWLRTRNLLLVVLLHGFMDSLPNTPRFMDLLGL